MSVTTKSTTTAQSLTRSGAKRHYGSLIGCLRNDVSNTKGFFVTGEPTALFRTQFGVAIGAPFKENRLCFVAEYLDNTLTPAGTDFAYRKQINSRGSWNRALRGYGALPAIYSDASEFSECDGIANFAIADAAYGTGVNGCARKGTLPYGRGGPAVANRGKFQNAGDAFGAFPEWAQLRGEAR